MHTYTHFLTPRFVRRLCAYTAIGAACVIGSFAVGVETAGDVRTIAGDAASALEASLLPADAGEGHGAIQDAIAILEVVSGDEPLPADWQALDTNSDGTVSASDALLLLHTLTL